MRRMSLAPQAAVPSTAPPARTYPFSPVTSTGGGPVGGTHSPSPHRRYSLSPAPSDRGAIRTPSPPRLPPPRHRPPPDAASVSPFGARGPAWHASTSILSTSPLQREAATGNVGASERRQFALPVSASAGHQLYREDRRHSLGSPLPPRHVSGGGSPPSRQQMLWDNLSGPMRLRSQAEEMLRLRAEVGRS